ncbi:MAG: WD40 repeat domain-containing protein [Myxococcaceae bacterium]
MSRPWDLRGWVALVLALAACRSVPPAVPDASLKALAASPEAYLKGHIVGFEPRFVLDRRDFVYTLALRPDGQAAAFTHLPGVSEFSLSAHALSTQEVEPPRTWTTAVNGYEKDVEGLAFSPDGRRLATVGREGSVRMFAADSGKLLWRSLGTEALVSVAFHPSLPVLVAGSAKGALVVLDVKDGTRLLSEALHSDEVRGLDIADNGKVATGSWDKSLRSLRLERDPWRWVVERSTEFPAFISDVCFDRTGKTLAVALSSVRPERSYAVYKREKRGEDAPLAEDDAAALMDAETHQSLRRFSGHRGVVASVALSPDGQTLVSGGWDATVRTYNVQTGEAGPVSRWGWIVRRVRFSRDGRWLGVAAWTQPRLDGRGEPSAAVLSARYAGDVSVAESKP